MEGPFKGNKRCAQKMRGLNSDSIVFDFDKKKFVLLILISLSLVVTRNVWLVVGASWLISIHVFVSMEVSLVHRIFTLGVRIFPIPEDGARAVGG